MSYDIGTVPGTASVLGSGSMTNITSGLAGSTAGDVGGGSQLMPFKVTKRTNPTVVAYDFDGTANAIRVYPANAKKTGVTALAVIRMDGSYQFMSFNSSSATAIPTSSNVVFGWTASAEL
jgi:precorrin-6B methylase 2